MAQWLWSFAAQHEGVGSIPAAATAPRWVRNANAFVYRALGTR